MSSFSSQRCGRDMITGGLFVLAGIIAGLVLWQLEPAAGRPWRFLLPLLMAAGALLALIMGLCAVAGAMLVTTLGAATGRLWPVARSPCAGCHALWPAAPDRAWHLHVPVRAGAAAALILPRRTALCCSAA